MPWDQVEEAAILIPPPAKQTTPAAEDHVAAPVEDVGASVSTEAASPRLEVLPQTSSQPIAQVPRRVRVPCHGITFRRRSVLCLRLLPHIR